MRGIIIEGVDVKFLQVYEVAIEYGGTTGTAIIDNSTLSDINTYGAEETMLEFLPTLSFLSGLILYYERAMDELQRSNDNIVSAQYVQFKSLSVESLLGRDGLSRAKANDIPADKLVGSMLSVLPEVKNSRKDIVRIKQQLNRLKASYAIVERVWETARSLNANERVERAG